MRSVRILVPTDFSQHTQVVLEVVQERYPQASIRLLHVGRAHQIFTWHMPAGLGGASWQHLPGLAKELKAEEQVKLKQIADGLGVEAELRQGDLVEGIAQAAQDWRPDLVVLHRLERRGWWGWISPSVSREVLRCVPADVMVIHLPRRLVDIYVGWAEREATGLTAGIGGEPRGHLQRR